MKRWTVKHTPAAATQATITKAAETGRTHWVTGLIVTFVAGASAPTAETLLVDLRAGATGAGNIIASWGMSIPAVAGSPRAPIALGDIEIPGEDGAALTLEFAAAGGANTVQAVTMIGETR